MFFRPATPGFLMCLGGTILLALVSFSTPFLKSIYFLKATIPQGTMTFGTLGYCITTKTNETCSSPQVGYEFNPNALLGNTTPFQIPDVAVRWLTYALVLHIAALVVAGVSAVFGLLAHVREMAMTCFSSCIAGFAAFIALIAFIFDLVLFFLARARINNVANSSSEIGIAVWLTLAAWVVLFFSGCFYGFGRCCVSTRPRKSRDKRSDSPVRNDRSEAMRLDAIKAEADRKARQKLGTQEVGLPAFTEYESKPLKSYEPEYLDEEVDVPYRDDHRPAGPRRDGSGYQSSNPTYAGGYAEPQGTRTIDAYNDRQRLQPQLTGSSRTSPAPQPSYVQAPSTGYPPTSQHSRYASPPPMPVPSQPYGASDSQYLAPQTNPRDAYAASGGRGSHAASHHTQASSYHSAVSHQNYPSAYSQTPAPQRADSTPAANAGQGAPWDQSQQAANAQAYGGQYNATAGYNDPYGGAAQGYPAQSQAYGGQAQAYADPYAGQAQAQSQAYADPYAGYSQAYDPYSGQYDYGVAAGQTGQGHNQRQSSYHEAQGSYSYPQQPQQRQPTSREPSLPPIPASLQVNTNTPPATDANAYTQEPSPVTPRGPRLPGQQASRQPSHPPGVPHPTAPWLQHQQPTPGVAYAGSEAPPEYDSPTGGGPGWVQR